MSSNTTLFLHKPVFPPCKKPLLHSTEASRLCLRLCMPPPEARSMEVMGQKPWDRDKANEG